MTGKARGENSSETEVWGQCQTESPALTDGQIYVRKISPALHTAGRASGFPQGSLGGCLGP